MKAMFIPEIASRCDRFESRSAATVSCVIPDRSPVTAPAAKAPACPGQAAMMAPDRRARSAAIRIAPGSGAASSKSGVRL